MPFDLDRYHARRVSTLVGARVRYVEETGSTMDDARAGADADSALSPGTAYVAGNQRAGRGRQGRQWVTAPGVGLYVTYHLRAEAAPTVPLLAAAGALAAQDALVEACALRTELKWPNDVLHGGRKLAGVLAEARHPASGTAGAPDVFLGIGINLRPNPNLPADVAVLATNVADAGGDPGVPETVLAALSNALERWSHEAEHRPRTLVDAWRSRLITLGTTVRLATPDGRIVAGEAVDVGDTGDLLVRHGDGTTGRYSAGDVTTVKD